MPFIEVNQALIYYEAFGTAVPGQPPVLLIHGSTVTGASDWGLVAPLLARRFHVIVPDCRGHGRSSNPTLSYSFRQMADDMASLLHALGHSSAHVVGHSNGGNVALLFLMETPELVQTAILQAANAYVSPDLLEREPLVFDPQRIAREAPAWMEEMVALHGPTHGEHYWLELIRLTLQETISQPNYTGEDLTGVQRPALVIQGENDPVNAPSRHAQFISRHIPFAELWIPAGTGHNVHKELLFPWIERVEDFLVRRGDEPNEALYRLRRRKYPDDRETVFEIRASATPGRSGSPAVVALEGRVLNTSQRQAAGEVLPEFQVDASRLRVLLTEDTPWALVNRPVNDLRREPRLLSERVSQALVGEAVRILEEEEGWSWVRMEHDGYMGWVQSTALHRCSQQAVEEYLNGREVCVQAALLPARSGGFSSNNGMAEAGKLPFGVRLPVETWLGDQVQVRLPDGRLWWVERLGMLALEDLPEADATGIQRLLALVHGFIGTPYLWGGRTPFGYDCSGLAQAFWGFLGVQLPRDADQQFRCGVAVEGPFQPGDLLFFGEPREDGQGVRYASVSHVAISLGGDEMIHSNGAAWGISLNSLDPSSPLYRPWLRDNLVGVRRYA